MSRKALHQGFTLTELLVALAVVIVLTVIAIPSFRQLYIDYHLTTTAQRLQYALQHARSEAIKNNTTVYAVFQPGTSWCYGTNVSSNCNCNLTNCTLTRVNAPTADITLSVTGMNSNSIQFDGAHGATNVSSTATFTLGSESITLKIGALGNMQLCSATISGYPACT